MKIVVGFSKSKKKFAPASWAIRMYQGGTKFSHVYIRLYSNGSLPSDRILHASEGKIQGMSGTQFDKRHCPVEEYEIEVSNRIYKQITDQMHETCGDDYSVMQNVGVALVDLCEVFGIHIRNPFRRGWNCSEFVSVILRNIHPVEFGAIDKNVITPKQVNKILKRLGYESRKN